MPSTITHTYISIDSLNKLNYQPKRILTNNIENYKTYSQGMDVLYFYHIFLIKPNKVQQLGHRFHNYKTQEIFLYLINKNRQNKDDELFTFICGLISHYQADSFLHPFINYYAYSENKIKMQDKHFIIETFLDCYLINKTEKENHTKFKNYQLQFNTKKETIIKETIDDLYSKYFNYDNMGNIYYKSLNEMYLVFKYLRYDPLSIKKNIYKFIDINHLNIRRLKYLSYNIELTPLTKYLNNEYHVWYNVKDKKITSNKSFDDLYNEVIYNTTLIINKLYQYIFEDKNIDITSLIKNNSYANGLPLE